MTPKPSQSAMFYAHLVEIGQNLVGVVAQSGDGYRFLAIDSAFAGLEAESFDGADDACSAAIALKQAELRSLADAEPLGAV